jgi:hypothetical protein
MLKESAIYSAEGKINTKIPRQRDFKRKGDKAPSTYTSNTIKEELCSEYIASFRENFSRIFPSRKTPFMIAKNEYGVDKFVCSTLRPTVTPIPELYDLHECASFMAGFIMYEPLDPQYEPPQYLFSPAATLNTNTGDSFDLATLVCSFLLGSGYDAYVVCGYAPKFITLRDQSRMQCPLINESMEMSSGRNSAETAGDQPETDESNTYFPLDNSVKHSEFIAKANEAKRVAALDTFKLWVTDIDVDEKKVMEDEKLREEAGSRRVHAWVLISEGRRDIKESVFLEPTTGRIFSINHSPYLGVESVWNNHNYWVNLQTDNKVSEVSIPLICLYQHLSHIQLYIFEIVFADVFRYGSRCRFIWDSFMGAAVSHWCRSSGR